jgi:hypothetical protein
MGRQQAGNPEQWFLLGRPETEGVTRQGDILGYAWVSTVDQDLSGQIFRLKDAGAIRVFEDVVSGKHFDRLI